MKLPAGYVPGEGVYKATAYGGFGERLLKRMGWEEGRGLGTNQHGIKSAIEVKRKEDQAGVGGKAGFAWEKKWWEEAYESKLQTLQTEDSDSDSSGDELTTYVNRDGTQSSATPAELKMAAELSKDPWGRFGGRAGKMARIRAQEAQTLAAMQGKLNGSSAAVVNGVSNGAPSQLSSKKRKAAVEEEITAASASKANKAKGVKQKSQECDKCNDCSAAPEAEPGMTENTRKKRKSQKAPATGSEGNLQPPQELKRKARVVHVVAAGEAPSLAAFKATPRSGWWGARCFTSAGCLEGLEHTAELVAKQRQTFTEQTQEDLYMSAHAGKSASKKGLGTSTAPRNVGGTSWQGQKTVFTDEVHGSDAVAPDGADAEVHTLASSQDHSTAGTFEKIKWKRIARQLLEQAEGGNMTLIRLRRKALKQALGGQEASKQLRVEARKIMMSRLQGSKSFTVHGDSIRLTSQT